MYPGKPKGAKMLSAKGIQDFKLMLSSTLDRKVVYIRDNDCWCPIFSYANASSLSNLTASRKNQNVLSW
jgi:hypothetical protein